MRLYSRRISHAQLPTFLQYICKNTKKIQKVDYMDGFCLQGELDLTLFYKIEGCWGIFLNPKSLMTLMTVTLMTGIFGIWKWLLMTLTLHDRILSRNKKDRSPHESFLRWAVDLFMDESAYYNKVDSMFFIPCNSLLRA